jgi:hypothetical protein
MIMDILICPDCGRELNPANHGELVCDGEVFCDGCRLYDRRLIQPREFEEIEEWGRRICETFGFEPVTLAKGDDRPPAGPFDFLYERKLLMAEAHHRQRMIILSPPGLRLATLCHELAHLMTGQDHTAAWAKMFARLVAWVKERLPKGHDTAGIYVNLLK